MSLFTSFYLTLLVCRSVQIMQFNFNTLPVLLLTALCNVTYDNVIYDNTIFCKNMFEICLRDTSRIIKNVPNKST